MPKANDLMGASRFHLADPPHFYPPTVGWAETTPYLPAAAEGRREH